MSKPLLQRLGNYLPVFLLALITLAGLVLRALGIDQGVGFHPDERHMVNVTFGLSLSDLNPKSFAYGSLPFYVVWLLAQGLSRFWPHLYSYDGVFYVGRTLTVILGSASIVLTYFLAKAIYNQRVLALNASLLLAFTVFHLQLSRYFTSDIFLSFTALLAFLSLVWVLKTQSWLAYVFAGVALGLSLACKISALSLFLPFAAAYLFRPWTLSSWGRIIFQPLVALFCAAVVFAVAMPYAILDFPTFWQHTTNEIQMVRGVHSPCYVFQYFHTAPYLYPLKQLYHYTMGEPLALACILGVLIAMLGQVAHFFGLDAHLFSTADDQAENFKFRGELLLLVFLLPFCLLVGSYQVKFPRYFLPLYPLLCIFGARALILLWQLSKTKIMRLAAGGVFAAVAGYSLIYSLAFALMWLKPHSYEQASRWIYKSVAPGSAILNVHWDDTLPLHLPGLAPERFKLFTHDYELPLYDQPDSEAKLNMLASRLATADYLAFPTARLPGSIAQVPEKYPLTLALIKLMYADKLGYRLEATFKPRPALGRLVWNDDLADESFSVYDHPKSSIFKNVERLSAEEIISRVHNAFNYDLPTQRDILLRDANAALNIAAPGSRYPVLGYAVMWFIVVELLGLLVAPLLAALLPFARDRAFGLAKAAGVLSVSLSAYFLTSLGILQSNFLSLWLLVLILAALSCITVEVRWGGWAKFLYDRWPEVLRAEAVFWGVTLLFLAFRFINPEIFWGEKPMDLGFLNYFVRENRLPPQDPWVAGRGMSYYYFGFFILACLHKLSGVNPAVGFNLSIATLVGFLACGAYTVILLFCKSWRSALPGSLALVLLSNLEVLRLYLGLDLSSLRFAPGRANNFDLFWASSRLFSSPTFAEYPIWTFLFADLHAHVVSLPFTLLVLGLISVFFRKVEAQLPTLILQRVALGLAWGALFLTSAWDFIAYGAVLGLAPLVPYFRGRKFGVSGAKSLIRDYFLIVAAAAIVVLSFVLQPKPENPVGWGYVTGNEFNTLKQVLTHYGIWLWPILIAAVILFFKRCAVFAAFSLKALLLRAGLSALVALYPLALGVFTYFSSHCSPRVPGDCRWPWEILAFSALIIFIAVQFCFRQDQRRAVAAAGLLLCTCGFLLSSFELLFIIDRMNTIFKFSVPLWICISLAAVFLFAELFTRQRMLRYALIVIAIIPAVLGLIGSAMNVSSMLTIQRTPQPRFTLDGTAYLDKLSPEDAARTGRRIEDISPGDAKAIAWINANIKGLPALLEAQGQSYGNFSRVQMHTGLPIVLGWEHHVFQRGLRREIIAQRRDDIRRIFSGTDADSALKLLAKYGVQLIFVGEIEKRNYAADGLKKFESRPDLFPLLYSAGETKIFTTLYSVLSPQADFKIDLREKYPG